MSEPNSWGDWRAELSSLFEEWRADYERGSAAADALAAYIDQRITESEERARRMQVERDALEASNQLGGER